jgi:hypothetical protein
MPATTLACRRPVRKMDLVGAAGLEACWLRLNNSDADSSKRAQTSIQLTRKP